MRTKEASARKRFLNQMIGYGCVALVVGAAPVWADTVTFQQGTGGYTSGQDTFLQQAQPTVDNSGSAAIGWDGDDPNGTGNDVYTLIRFDNIFGGGAGQIPLGEEITEATLYLQIFDPGDPGQVHAINNAWSDTATFTSFCGASCDEGSEYGPLVTTAAAAAVGEIAINVRVSVQAWSDGASNNGWIIRPNPDNGSGGVDARSNEFGTVAQRPRLEVRYGEGPPPVGGLEREPYLQLGTPTSMTVCWRSDVSSNSRVQYGTTLALGSEVNDAAVVTDHCVEVTGLTPDTQYFYNVGSSASVQGGGTADHYFVTSPTSGTAAPFTFWAVGDGGNGSGTQVSVMNAMLTENGGVSPDMAIYLGDIAYNSGTDAEFTNNYFTPYDPVIRNMVVWPTLGNHEGASTTSGECNPSCASTGPYYESFVLPTAGEAGGTASGTEAYYSFDYGNVHFISLNSNEVSRSPTGPMAMWLTSDLAATTQQWIVAFWHHPPYSKGTHNSDTEGNLVDMRENLLPILEAGGVDLVMAGHSHIYERSYLIDGTYNTPTPNFATLEGNGNIIDDGDGRLTGDGAYLKSPGPNANEGAVYVVAGHGGQGTGGAGNHPVMFFSETANGSCLVDVDANTISLRNVRVDGVVTDTFTIQKGDIPPRVALTSPGKEAVLGGLTDVAVTFTTGVNGVSADDLTVNGSVATSVTGAAGTAGPYTFSGFTPPSDGPVSVVLAAGGIADALDPGLLFAGDSWSYTVDTTPPVLVAESPVRDATVVVLPSIGVTFSKPVSGVVAGDLTVNGSAATSVSGVSGTSGPYTFSGYAAPAEGLVSVVLSAGAIEDDQSQAFAGDSWNYVFEPGLIINEFLASNNTVNSDETGGFDDWLEIYNPGSGPVDMSGMHLTDNLGFPAQYQIPSGVVIPAGGYLLFWCDSSPGQGPQHTNFNLARTGEDIGLFDTAANGFAPIDTLTYPIQTTDVASGRFPDGAGPIVVMATPTPGASNVVGCAVPSDCDSLDDQCVEGDCQGGLCVAVPANEGLGCDDDVACTDSDVCTAGTCAGVSNCLTGETCNPVTGLCDVSTLATGDVIISGIQASGTDEWIELFNTTASPIALDNIELITRIDANGDGSATIDWQFAGSLAGQSIPAQGFYLLREGAGPPAGDFTGALDLATGEGSSRAISLELAIDSIHMDYVLYGREDLEPGATADVPPGDLPFDGTTFPRAEVIRNCGAQGVGGTCAATGSFNEGATLRLSDVDLYAGHDVDGRYTDEATLGDGYAAGVWTSDHATSGANTPRNSSSPTVAPPAGDPCTIDDDCDDSDVCNGDETCVAGFCAAGTPLDCDDANPCTDDSCDALSGCSNLNNTAPCDDGDACTSVDTCSGGVCVGGRGRDCDDGVACTDDSCDSVLGCQNIDNCTGGDVCNTGTGLCEPPGSAPPLPILPGDTWTYFKGTSEPTTPLGDLAWAQVGFDDSSWLSGPSGFGYGDISAPNTLLPDMQNGYNSVYFRREFSIVNPGAVDSLILTVDYDDSFVAYVNGVEVVRTAGLLADGSGTPQGVPTTFDQLANFPANTSPNGDQNHESSGGAGPNPAEVFDIGLGTTTPTPPAGVTSGTFVVYGGTLAGLLQAGNNAIAIHGHNVTAGSSDFVIVPTLTATFGGTCTVDGDCDDVDNCTVDTCPAGTCVFTPVDCGAQICDPADGSCVDCVVDGDCDDNDVCNGTETCSAGSCSAGTPLDCDDGVACTDDSCDAIAGCQNADNCPGGQTCNTGSGLCETGPAMAMFQQGVDGYSGTQDTFLQEDAPANVNGALDNFEWDGQDGTSGTPNTGLLRFDNIFGNGVGQIPFGSTIDSATLTLVVIDPSVVPAADIHESLSDWDQATASFTSFGGAAGITAATGPFVALAPLVNGSADIDVTASLQAWSDGTANFGWVFIPNATNGVIVDSSEFATIADRPKLTVEFQPGGCTIDDDCADGNVCNGTETCTAGSCVAGTPLDCDDSNACTDDACDPVLGCMNTNNSDPCDDGDACTENDVCAGGSCSGGTPLDCDDGIACTADSCDSGSGCENVDNCPVGQLCNAGTGLCETVPLLSCQLGDLLIAPSGTTTLDTFVQNVNDLRAYQTRITIVPTSGSGTVTVNCPGGVDIDEIRADFVFNDPAITSTVLTTIDCAGREAAAAPLDPESVNVTTPRYLSSYTLSASGDAAVGSTFDVFIDPSPGSILRDTANAPIPFAIAPACTLTIGSPSGELSLNVAPGSDHVLIGETVTVTLDVADLVEPINGVQALISFDDSLLSLIDITPTDLGLMAPASGWLELAENVVGGDITYSVGIFGGGETMANGTVATLTFQALANGVTNFSFAPDAPPLITKLTAADDAAALIPDKVDSQNMAIGICDDTNACTDDNFDGAACSNLSNVPIGQCCDPADGALSTIDDNDECTDDVCDAGTGVVTHPPNYDVATECCNPISGAIVLIDDLDGCTDDACDPGSGAVTHTVNYDVVTECCDPADGSTVPIDDADACTDDSCDAGTGVVSNTPNYSVATECCNPADGVTTIIDDGSECTVDSCDPGTGIVTNAPTYDVATECCDPVTGLSTLIDDGDACTDDECNALTGIVQHIPNYDTLSECCDPSDGSVTMISDGSACTDDLCDALTGAVTHPVNYDVATECCNPTSGAIEIIDDGSACTDDFCDPGSGMVTNAPNYDEATECCDPVDGTTVSTDDGDTCTADVCDPLTGEVTHPLGYDPIAECCDPSDGTIETIDDMNECTDDLCNPGTGEVIHLNNTDPCDDLDACTTGDVCAAGVCSGVAIDCSDGEFCNGAEVCVAGVCEPGMADPCPDVCEFCDVEADACAWCILDLDFNGVMGTGDFALFSPCFGACYTSGDPCELSNFDGDAGICVGTADYATFLGCFGDGCADCPACAGPGGPEPQWPRTAVIEVVPTTRRHYSGHAHSLPRGVDSITVGEELDLEIWARLDALDSAALASVFVDVEFEGATVDVLDVVPDNQFGTLTSALIDDKAGQIEDLGGCVAPGVLDIGSDGAWVRVATVRTRVRESGTTFINLYPTGSLRGTAVVGDYHDLSGAQLDIGRAVIEVVKDHRSSSIGTRKQK